MRSQLALFLARIPALPGSDAELLARFVQSRDEDAFVHTVSPWSDAFSLRV